MNRSRSRHSAYLFLPEDVLTKMSVMNAAKGRDSLRAYLAKSWSKSSNLSYR